MMPEDNKNKTVQDELESLYRNVAQNDLPREESDKGMDLSACYAALQVSPDATLVEIADAYDRMKDTWREDRFVNVGPWQEKSKEKLAELKEAYEKIISYRPYESTNRVHEPEINRDDLLMTDQEASLSEKAHLDPDMDENKPHQSRGRLMAGAIAAVLAVLLGAFVWPTLYRYDIIKAGDKIYPLRINRLTSDITYFNGKAWTPPPVPVDVPVKQTEPIKPAAPPAIETVSPPVTRPPGAVAANQPKPEGKMVPAVVPKKKIDDERRFNISKSAPAAPSEPPKRKASPPARSAEKSVKEGAYGIQIKAFQEEAKAKAYLQTLNTDRGKMRIRKTVGKDQKTWYRVLLGNFNSRDEAAAYLQKKKILQTYPGSFVQSTGTGT